MLSRAFRVSAAVVGAATLVVAACGPTSRVDRAASVSLATHVRGPDGSPGAGLPVVLTRETGVAELFGGFFLSSLTLFTACLADPPPAVCRGGFRRTATSGPDGSAAFSLTGSDTQGFFGTAERFALSTRLPATGDEQAGPATTERFRIQSTSVSPPDVRLWHPAVSVAAADARWDALPSSGYGSGSGYRLTFEDTAGAAVWTFESDATSLRYDPRVLEDTRGGATVLAKRSLSGTEVLYASARLGYAGTAGAPPSRGRPCTIQIGSAPAEMPPTCPLTDGDFTRPLSAPTSTTTSSTSTGPTSAATVDLGSPQPISLVVVRGCACTVEASADGKGWTAIGRSRAADDSLVPSRSVSARYVRVRNDGSLEGLREVSVWSGEPPSAAGATSGVGGGSSPPAGPASRTGWVLAAGLVLGLALGAGAGVAIRSRRR